MRITAWLALSLTLIAQPAAAQSEDSSPPVKSLPTVASCLHACDESHGGAAEKLKPNKPKPSKAKPE